MWETMRNRGETMLQDTHTHKSYITVCKTGLETSRVMFILAGSGERQNLRKVTIYSWGILCNKYKIQEYNLQNTKELSNFKKGQEKKEIKICYLMK